LPLFDGGASLARIISVTNGASAIPCSVSLGRDLLWVGGFEDEGSTVWYLNSAYEWLDTQYVHAGEYSLGLVRESSNPYNVVTNLEDRIPINSDKGYSLIGSIQTFNANQASMITMWYRSRTGDNLSRRDTVSTPVSGTANWTFQWEHMIPPDNANFVDIRCNLFPPSDGTAYAYYDDLAFIEWETPENLLPFSTEYPNDLRYLRVFTGQVLDSVTVNYRTVRQWLP
jgi:hypothetical protein